MNRSVFYVLIFLSCAIANNASALTPTEESDLLFMREEEKVARDVYLEMDLAWHKQVFTNIAEAEQRHMDAMLRQLENYDLPDPVGYNPPGVFTDGALQAMYDEQLAAGQASLLAAMQTGAYIEERDIADLRIAIGRAEEESLVKSYNNLLAGSRNHLRAFYSHVIALGGSYEPQVLSQEDFDEITSDFSDMPGGSENFSINPGLNDAWFYPELNGQGFVITVFPGVKKVFLAWFTFDVPREDADDEAVIGHIDQRWFIAQGAYSGAMAELEVYSLEGGVFDTGQPVPAEDPHGAILLQFENCNSGSVTYDLLANGVSFEGFIPIQRVNTENVALCQQFGQGNGAG